jgi:imidazolonepropionase-like amidohydrolase
LIRGATIWTAKGQILPNTDLLAIDGRIRALGVGLAPRAGIKIVEGRGRHLTPGLIDPHSHIGVYPLPELQAHRDGNEVARPASPDARAEDAYWPQDPAIPRALAAGVTTAQILPGSANLFGGRAVVVHLIPGRHLDDVRFSGAPPAVKLACGENPKRVYRKNGGPSTRMGNLARLRRLFEQARAYTQNWQRYRAQLETWQALRAKRCEKDPIRWALPPKPPAVDYELETVSGLLEGRIRAHVHCYRADDMAGMLRLAKSFGFRIAAFHHATEAYKIRDLLRQEGTAAVTWVNWWGFKAEAADAIPENAALVHSAGTLVSLHSDSPRIIQRFNQEAGIAFHRGRAMGLPLRRSDALAFVTLNPARVLGIDHLTGSLEPGKVADMVLWDGDPLSAQTRSVMVFVDGAVRYERKQGRYRTDIELGEAFAAERDAGGATESPPISPTSLAYPAPNDLRGDATTTILTNVRLLTPDGRFTGPATVHLAGPRIAAVYRGTNRPKAANAERIDGGGRLLTPGLIAVETNLGLIEISLEPTTRDNAPKTGSIHAALRADDSLNLQSWAIPVTRIEGFTSAVARPAGGLISGTSAAFDLDGSVEAAKRRRPAVALHIQLGRAGATAVGGNRALAMMRLRQIFADARRLAQNQRAVEGRRYRQLSAPIEQLEALFPAIERKIPVVVRASRASDILAALDWARAENVRLLISGGAEAWRVATQLARHKVPVLVDVDTNLPASFDSLGGRYDNAAILARHGVPVVVSASGQSHNVRVLRQLAAIAASWGLPRHVALAALTSTPARVFGLTDRGEIAPGKLANLVLWQGDPLALDGRPKLLFIGGKRIPLVSRQTRLRERYRRLNASEPTSKAPSGSPTGPQGRAAPTIR